MKKDTFPWHTYIGKGIRLCRTRPSTISVIVGSRLAALDSYRRRGHCGGFSLNENRADAVEWNGSEPSGARRLRSELTFIENQTENSPPRGACGRRGTSCFRRWLRRSRRHGTRRRRLVRSKWLWIPNGWESATERKNRPVWTAFALRTSPNRPAPYKEPKKTRSISSLIGDT